MFLNEKFKIWNFIKHDLTYIFQGSNLKVNVTIAVSFAYQPSRICQPSHVKSSFRALFLYLWSFLSHCWSRDRYHFSFGSWAVFEPRHRLIKEPRVWHRWVCAQGWAEEPNRKNRTTWASRPINFIEHYSQQSHLRPKWQIKHVLHDIHLTFSFGDQFYLNLPLLSKRPVLRWYLLHLLRSILTKFGFAVVISPVSVANKTKVDDFDISPHLDFTRDMLKKIFKILQSTRLELSIAALPASLWPLQRVRFGSFTIGKNGQQAGVISLWQEYCDVTIPSLYHPVPSALFVSHRC